VLLIAYSTHGLARPAMKPIIAGARADAGVGLLNGILGGATGLAGIIVTIWCGLRGWPKDQQRTVFQPVGVAVFAMSALWLGASGAVGIDTLRLFAIGLPILLAGTWLGLKLYGRVDDAGFRKIVLTLLLVSGVALLFSLRQTDLLQWARDEGVRSREQSSAPLRLPDKRKRKRSLKAYRRANSSPVRRDGADR
jgi:uncharacterized protein